MKKLIWTLIIINFGCTPIFNYKNSSCADEKLIRISKVAEFAKKNKKQPYDILTEQENSYYIDNIQNCPDLYDHYAKLRKNKFDIVDLDPFGSAFNCFDLAIQTAQKGLIITTTKKYRIFNYETNKTNIVQIDTRKPSL